MNPVKKIDMRRKCICFIPSVFRFDFVLLSFDDLVENSGNGCGHEVCKCTGEYSQKAKTGQFRFS